MLDIIQRKSDQAVVAAAVCNDSFAHVYEMAGSRTNDFPCCGAAVIRVRAPVTTDRMCATCGKILTDWADGASLHEIVLSNSM